MLSNVPDEIKLATGASATIKLKGLATAGYLWNYTTDDDKNCITITKEFVQAGQSAIKKMGASADEVFTITAQRKGTVHIYFFQGRSWEKNTDAADKKTVSIIIE